MRRRQVKIKLAGGCDIDTWWNLGERGLANMYKCKKLAVKKIIICVMKLNRFQKKILTLSLVVANATPRNREE